MSAPKLAAVDEHGVPVPLAWFRRYLAAVGSSSNGSGPISTRKMWQCAGPAHGDGDARPSLSTWWQEDRGRVGVHCHSGCKWPEPLPTLGLRKWDRSSLPSALSPAAYAHQQGVQLAFPKLDTSGRGGGGPDSGFKLEAFHDYGEHRKVRYRHPVTGEKHVPWEYRGARGAWIPGLGGTRECDLPIYYERDIRMARAAGELVVLCESESSCDALVERGITATTWAGSATSVHVDALRKVLDGYDRLVVIPDYDERGFDALDTLLAAKLAPHVLYPDEPGQDAKNMVKELGSAGLQDELEAALRVPPGPRPPLDDQAADGGAEAQQDGPPGKGTTSETTHHDLDAATDPNGRDVHEVVNNVSSFRWLLSELGARGLSGVFLRGEVPVFTARVGEEGYITPPKDKPGTPEHRRNSNGPATMRPVSTKMLRTRLALNYLVWKWTNGATPVRRECFFPVESAEQALEAIDAAPNIRPLVGVTHTPMARADGTILDTPGYDDASGYLLLPSLDVPTGPARADGPAARRRGHAPAGPGRRVRLARRPRRGELPGRPAHPAPTPGVPAAVQDGRDHGAPARVGEVPAQPHPPRRPRRRVPVGDAAR